jgi:hypothetical protein
MRQAALEIIEFALEQTAPYKAVQSLVRLDGSQLTVGNLQLNLEDHQRIFLSVERGLSNGTRPAV